MDDPAPSFFDSLPVFVTTSAAPVPQFVQNPSDPRRRRSGIVRQGEVYLVGGTFLGLEKLPLSALRSNCLLPFCRIISLQQLGQPAPQLGFIYALEGYHLISTPAACDDAHVISA